MAVSTKKKYIHIFFLIISVCISNTIYCQKVEPEKSVNFILKDISEIIPPLAVLIDSAYENSAIVKSREADMSYKKTSIKSTSKLWLKNIGLETYYNYGTADYYSINNTSGNQALNTSVQTTNRYSVGAYIRLPLYDLLDRKNLINADKYRYEQAYYEKENEKFFLRKQVILQYNDVILKQKLFRITNESLIESKLQAEMAEKEFAQGEINLTELARLKDMSAKSMMQYEQSKFDFINAYLMLQELSGIKFISLKFIE
jgi:outer membrane protein TolC